MHAREQTWLRTCSGAALALSLLLIRPLFAGVDLAAEVDKALQEAGKPAGEADSSPVLRLEALVRQAKTPEQLRLIEARLVQTLESEAPWSAKQAVCRVLWHIGSARSAPALKKLLAQPQTVDIACYAVSNSRVAELGQAARDTLAGSTGRVAVGLLNLLGQRRDAEAVGLIIPFLQNDQPAVTLAAAAALGKIGGRPAVTALDAFRKVVSKERRTVADDAYLRALETLEPALAGPLWQALVAAKDERGPVRRAALLGLSQHAPDAAWPWLLAALQEKDVALFPGTGQALRSLRDQPVALQAAASLPGLPAASQIIVMESLGVALPAETLTTLMERSEDGAVRRSALRNLGARGGPRVVALLLARALSPDAAGERREILAMLSDLPGQEVTDAILRTLPEAPAPLLPDLARLLVARSAGGIAVPLLDRASAGDTASRLQAVRALRVAAGAGDRAALARLLKGTGKPEVHEAIEQAIGFVCSRCGQADEHAEWLRSEIQSARRPQDRQALLRLLSRTGTAAALQTILAAAREGSAEERSVAFLALAQWPNEAALKPLLELSGGPLNEAQRVQALRGAVDLLRKSMLPASQRTDCFGRLVPLVRDPSDRKFLLSGLAEVPDAGALRLIAPSLNDAAVRAEAAMAAVAVASKLGVDQDAAVNSAMNKVLAAVEDAGLRDRARSMIRTPPRRVPDVFLDTLTPVRAVSGNDGGKGRTQINRNCIGQPLKLKGVTYERGVGEHAPAELIYEIKPAYRRFVCVVGLDDQVARYHDLRGSIVVKVFADDKLLAQTPVLRGGGASADVDAALPAGAKALRLVVGDAGDGTDFDDADFVNAGFIGTDGSAPPAAPRRPAY
jgi:HEAT repeat protein